jgi:phage repressor protein C with HTH and peptisase S24 domain
LIETIDEALKVRGMTDAEASRLAVGNPALIKNLRRPQGGSSRPNYHAIEALAEVLGLELYFGPPRGRPPVPQAVDEDLTYVPRYDIAAAAGPGSIALEEAPVGYVAFRSGWLRSRGLVADRLGLFDIAGSSGEPDLRDGDLALVDLRTAEPRLDRHYIFRDIDDTIRVKKLVAAHEALYFKSLAAGHDDVRRAGPDAERIHIIGRVAWIARSLD